MSLLEKIMTEVGEVDEVGEVVSLLRNSRLPTVIVEESSDTRIYMRWVERHLFGTYKIDVLDAGGKDNLLSLYERKSEFTGLPVVFVANRGTWMFSGIPEKYEDIVCTRGYSIENDVYSMSRIEGNLLDPARAWEHWLIRESIIRWFSFELENIIPQELLGSKLSLSDLVPKDNFEHERFIAGLNLDDLIPKGSTELDGTFCKHRGFCWPGTEIIEKVSEKYRFNLPGKLLFQMLNRYSITSLQALYNIALTNYESAPGKLIQKIKSKLENSESSPATQLIPSGPPVGSPPEEVKFNTSYSSYFSAADLIDNLKARTPTVIIEQESDNRFNWWVEESKKGLKPYSIDRLDILSLIGRNEFKSLMGTDEFLSIYKTKSQFSDIPVAFVGNRKMQLFVRSQANYKDIIWTRGYDIENDLYVQANLERLLEPHETWKHRQVRNSVIEWFAFEVEEFLAGKREKIDMDFELSDIVPEGGLGLDERFCQHVGFRQPSTKLVQRIRKEYRFLLPGKFLFQILARFLNARGRNFNFINITNQGLYDIALTMRDPAPLNGLILKIKRKLDDEENRIRQKHSLNIGPARGETMIGR